MRIHRPQTLKAFWTKHPEAEGFLRAWFHETTCASWRTPAELKSQYRSASILTGGRAVFSGCGDKYCLVVLVNYHAHIIVVRWIGTRADYDGISAERI